MKSPQLYSWHIFLKPAKGDEINLEANKRVCYSISRVTLFCVRPDTDR